MNVAPWLPCTRSNIENTCTQSNDKRLEWILSHWDEEMISVQAFVFENYKSDF